MMQHDLLCLALAGVIGAGPVLAQMPDPTRPAGALLSPDAEAAVAAPVASGVQTVILRSGGKSAAVINGQYVEVGGKLGDKKVLLISESEVVLKGENGREVIRVTPDIEKVPAGTKAAIKQRTTRTTEQ